MQSAVHSRFGSAPAARQPARCPIKSAPPTSKPALLGLGLPNVSAISVTKASDTYTVSFMGSPQIQSEDLTLIPDSSKLVSNTFNTPANITVQSWSVVVQSVTVRATTGAYDVTVGNALATMILTAGESAAAFQSALIAAIASTNLVGTAGGVGLGPNDVLVDQVGNTYYVTYQGLLRGLLGQKFLLSVAPSSTVAQQGPASTLVGINAVSGTFTISAGAGLVTYSLPWNASASAVQSALSSLLNNNAILVTAVSGGFQISGLPAGVAGNLDVDASMLDNPVVIGVRADAINYDSVTTLNLDLAPHDNVVNIRGTTAVTNVFGHGGNEQFFVSSLAGENLQTAQSADFLLGNLEFLLGNLNLAAGAGTHKLLISNEGSVSGVPNGVITSAVASPTALPGTEIEVRGFSTGAD